MKFQPNQVQRKYLAEIAPNWESEPVRLSGAWREILLKARQFGFSTLILGLYFLDTIQNPNTQTVVIAHDADSSQRIFQAVHRFQEHLPEGMRPRTKYSSRREILWSDLDSYFFVGTAGSGSFGRGGTVNNVHGSEVAFWPDAETIVSGLFNTVPADGNIILESTANGQSNWFYDEYQNAKRGNSRFTPRFYGWWEHDEYRSEVPEGFEPDAEELALAARYSLDLGQLAWRREKKIEQRRLFVQEYPANAQEAFISSGGRVLHEFIAEPAPYGHLYHNDWIPPKDWRHFLVIDPGLNTFAALFAAVDPEGCIWLYGEYYEGRKPRGQQGEDWLPSEHFANLDAAYRIYSQQAGGPIEYRVLMDPNAFNLMRVQTSATPLPSWADELRKAARESGAEWFSLTPASNADGLALRPNRYLATGRVCVGDDLENFCWEAERWVTKRERSGQYADETQPPEEPIDAKNHLMDTFRYLCNALPEALPVPPPPRPNTLEVFVADHLERKLKQNAKRRQMGARR